MVTREQKQTVWAPYIKNLAEMLEPHLPGKKLQEESKPWHPEPPAHIKLLHIMLHWENKRAATATRCQQQICLGDIQQTKQVSAKPHASGSIPPATPGINQHNPLGRLT
jgi:hypothetical protein